MKKKIMELDLEMMPFTGWLRSAYSNCNDQLAHIHYNDAIYNFYVNDDGMLHIYFEI